MSCYSRSGSRRAELATLSLSLPARAPSLGKSGAEAPALPRAPLALSTKLIEVPLEALVFNLVANRIELPFLVFAHPEPPNIGMH